MRYSVLMFYSIRKEKLHHKFKVTKQLSATKYSRWAAKTHYKNTATSVTIFKKIYLKNRAIFECNDPQNACEILDGVLLVMSLNCISCILNLTSIGGYASCLLKVVFFLILLQMRNAALWGLILVSYIPFRSITPQYWSCKAILGSVPDSEE